MNELKTCRRCGIEKSLDAFGIDQRRKDGHANYCKECKRIISREEYRRNLESYRTRTRLKKDSGYVIPPEQETCSICQETSYLRHYVFTNYNTNPKKKIKVCSNCYKKLFPKE